jgi:hypothetical protein
MTEKAPKSAKPPTKSNRSEKPAGKTPSRRKRTTQAPEPPTHDEIAECAYHIYLNEGGDDPLAHWLRAKGELTNSWPKRGVLAVSHPLGSRADRRAASKTSTNDFVRPSRRRGRPAVGRSRRCPASGRPSGLLALGPEPRRRLERCGSQQSGQLGAHVLLVEGRADPLAVPQHGVSTPLHGHVVTPC